MGRGGYVLEKRRKELREIERTVALRELSGLQISVREVLGQRKKRQLEDIEQTKDEELAPGQGKLEQGIRQRAIPFEYKGLPLCSLQVKISHQA